MPSMDVGIELSFSQEASEEVVLSVDFDYRAGAPAHMGSLSMEVTRPSQQRLIY